jgi:hypothetical protein
MLTPDGYINDQHLTRPIRYGCMTSDQNGCGWIAVFNVLRRLEEVAPDPAEIARLMSRGVILRGLLGTYIHSIIGFLRRRGCKVRWTFRKSAQAELAARADASIFLYCGPWSGFLRWPRLQGHYIALYPEQDGRFRVFNHGSDPCRIAASKLYQGLLGKTPGDFLDEFGLLVIEVS